MAETNEYGVPVHPWSWKIWAVGSVLVWPPTFIAGFELVALQSPWIVGPVCAGLGMLAVAWGLDRESSRQTKVVRAYLGMRWGETMQDWKTHRTDAFCWTLSLGAAWSVDASGGPQWVVVLILVLNGRLALSNGVSAVQGWRREREGLPAPECPDLAPVPLTSEPLTSEPSVS